MNGSWVSARRGSLPGPRPPPGPFRREARRRPGAAPGGGRLTDRRGEGDPPAQRAPGAHKGGPERAGGELRCLVPGRLPQRAQRHHRHLAPPRAHDVQGDPAVSARRDRAHALPERGQLQRQHVLRLDELLRDSGGRPPRARHRARGRPDGPQPDRQGRPRLRDDGGPERAGGERTIPRPCCARR